MAKIITVFGATGNQGGSVIKEILADPVLSKEFRIRAVTRDPSKPASQALAQKGVDVIAADMDSPASIATAVDGSHTVFLVTNFWETMDMDKEYDQGTDVADAAKASKVKHLIFSSLIHTTEASAGRLAAMRHFDGKANIERYIRELGVPATFVLPGFFMTNLKQALRKNQDGSFTLGLPVTEMAQFPLFDAAGDTGKYVVAAIKHRDTTLGKQIYAATDYYTPQRIVDEFTEVTGHPTKFVQVSDEEFQRYLPDIIKVELLQTHQLLDSPGYYAGASLEASNKLLDGLKPTSWKEFIPQVPEWN